MRLLRLLGATFSVSVRRSLAHRINLAFDIAQSFVGIGTVLLTTLAVYYRTDTLAGWSKAQALVLLGVYTIVSGVRTTFIDASMGRFVGAIRDGTLDEALLKPAPSWFTTTCAEHTPLALGQCVLGLGILVVGAGALPAYPGPLNVAVALVLICCGVAISWALSLAVACLGFWAGRLELAPLTGSLWDVGRYPADVYRGSLRTIVTYLVPVAAMVTLPAEALTRTTPLAALATGVPLTVCFVALAIVLFRRGLRRYTGATS